MSQDPDSVANATTTTGVTSDIISRIEGVRPCIRCGHDLHGQPIRRETSLGLLIAFCPECGTVAALAEHPTLGVWGRRLGIAAMIAAIIAVIMTFILTILALFGMTMGVSIESVKDARSALTDLNSGNWQIERSWWEMNADAARVTMWNAVDWTDESMVVPMLLFVPLCFVIGIIWSGMLLGLRRRYLFLPGLAMLGFAWLILVIAVGMIGFDLQDQLQISVYRLAEKELLPMVGMLVLVSLGIPVILGLLGGRTILRATVTFVLPPRARPMLRPLWEIDGKSPNRIADD